MPKVLEPHEKQKLVSEIEKYSKIYNMSQISRILNISPSAVRFHGLEAGITFTVKKGSNRTLCVEEGKFFNESHRENWLV